MTAKRFDLYLEQGSDVTIRVPVTDADGQPLDVTGWTVRAQVRERVSAPDVLHEWSTALGTVTTTPGQVELVLTAAESAAWGWDSGVYDVELTSPGGQVARILEGGVRVSREVTR